MSYSQYEEEAYILQAFEQKNDGRFLDIGAWHPKDKSNTRALFERGWSGVLIEPSPGPMLNLLEAYGDEERVTLIQACVANESFVRLHVTDDAVSSPDGASFEQWRNEAHFRGTLLVPGISLNSIASQFGGFDFVNVDAEGTSADLFLEMLALGWQPRCFCVEHDGRTTEIASAATPLHYHAVYVNGTNIVLVRK